MMKSNWNEHTHPDCRLDVTSNDLPEFADMDELPFLPPDYSPKDQYELAYAEYAVWCIRTGYNLIGPTDMLERHNSKACLLTLDDEQVRTLQVFIQRLDVLEDEKLDAEIEPMKWWNR